VERPSKKNKTVLQQLVIQIRYLAEQPNFSKDQRIKTTVTTE